MKLKFIALTLSCVLIIALFSGCISVEKTPIPPAETTTAAVTTGTPEQPAEDPLLKMTDRERVSYILNIDIGKLPSVNSYTETFNLLFSATYMGEEIDTAFEGNAVCTDLKSAQKGFYLNEYTCEVECDGLGVSENFEVKSGYVDGKIFEYSSDSNGTYALYSPTTIKEYRDYLSMPNLGVDDIFDIADENSCTYISCKQDVDGGWTAVLTDFTDAGIDKLNLVIGDLLSLADQEMVDCELGISIDKNHYPKSFTMDIEFDDNSNDNVYLSMEATFSNYNSTTPQEIDLSDYTELENLIGLLIAKRAIENAENAPKVTFDYEKSAIMTNNGQPITSSFSEFSVNIENAKDSYSFVLDGVGSSDIFESEIEQYMSYKDGVLEIVVDGESSSMENVAILTAKSYVTPFVDSAGLDINLNITEIEVDGNDYIFSLSEPKSDELQILLNSLEYEEYEVISLESTLRVTIDKGKLASYKYVTLINSAKESDAIYIDFSVEGSNFVIVEK